MKKLFLLVPLMLAGCVSKIPPHNNITLSENGTFIEEIKFDWSSNKNFNELEMCIKREMPILANQQTQDVIRAIDKKNKIIVGDGSFTATKYTPMLKSGNVKFKYEIKDDGALTKLKFTDIYSSYPTNQYTKLQPYSELLADTIYEDISKAANKIKSCK